MKRRLSDAAYLLAGLLSVLTALAQADADSDWTRAEDAERRVWSEVWNEPPPGNSWPEKQHRSRPAEEAGQTARSEAARREFYESNQEIPPGAWDSGAWDSGGYLDDRRDTDRHTAADRHPKTGARGAKSPSAGSDRAGVSPDHAWQSRTWNEKFADDGFAGDRSHGGRAPGNDAPNYRFRGDPAVERGDRYGSDERGQYRFRPLSANERERRQKSGQEASDWRPFERTRTPPDESGTDRRPGLFDSLTPPDRARDFDPYARPER